MTIRRIRLVSGLVLLTYLATHFINHALGLISLEAMEADMIRLALGRYRGHMTEVAKRLGIGRSTLYRKMREFGLEERVN